MKKLLMVLPALLLVLMPAVFAYAQVNTIQVSGYGTTKTAAIDDAKRNAVEQGLGVIIASETLVRNAQVLSDRIYSKASGFVKTYKELSSRQEADGNFVVKIEAVVTDILDEIVKDQIALDLLLDWLNKPRFMVIIDENILGDIASIVSESEIGKLLKEKNFDLVSKSQVDNVRARAQSLSALDGNLAEAAAIGTEFGAEIFVQGKADASAVELKGETYAELGLEGMYSGQASITASVIRTDTGDILATNTFMGKSTHISENIAAVEAMVAAAKELAGYLITESVRTWSLEQSNVRTFKLRISNVNFKARKAIETFLKGLEGVENVRRISFGQGTALLSLEYAGGVLDDLADKLDSRSIDDFSLEITGDSPGTLLLQVVRAE